MEKVSATSQRYVAARQGEEPPRTTTHPTNISQDCSPEDAKEQRAMQAAAGQGRAVELRKRARAESPKSASRLTSTSPSTTTAPRIERLQMPQDQNAILQAAQTFKEEVDEQLKSASTKSDVERARLIDTQGIAALLVDEARDGGMADFHIYRVNGRPTGMLMLVIPTTSGPSSTPCIEYMATLPTRPDSPGGGGALLEAAVNQSHACGHHGKLFVASISDEATNFYLAMGFVEDSLNDMSLNPAANNKWFLHENTWRRRRADTVTNSLNDVGQNALADAASNTPERAPRRMRLG